MKQYMVVTDDEVFGPFLSTEAAEQYIKNSANGGEVRPLCRRAIPDEFPLMPGADYRLIGNSTWVGVGKYALLITDSDRDNAVNVSVFLDDGHEDAIAQLSLPR